MGMPLNLRDFLSAWRNDFNIAFCHHIRNLPRLLLHKGIGGVDGKL